MKIPSLSKNSTTTTTSPPPPSSPQRHLPDDDDAAVVPAPTGTNPTIEGSQEGKTLKMVEDLNLSAGGDTDGGNGDDDGDEVVSAPNPTIEGSQEGKTLKMVEDLNLSAGGDTDGGNGEDDGDEVVSAPNPTIEDSQEGKTLKMVEDLNLCAVGDADGDDGDDNGDDVVSTPNPAIEGSEKGNVEGKTLKTPVDMVDLNGDGGSPVGSFVEACTKAVMVPDGRMLVQGGGLVRDGKLRSIDDKRKSGALEVVVNEKVNKKPRLCDVNDPPRGPPTCQTYQRRCETWKGALGHKHPGREFRGFFKPPVFGSSSPSPPTRDVPSNDDDDNNKGVEGEATKVGDGERAEEKRAASPERGADGEASKEADGETCEQEKVAAPPKKGVDVEASEEGDGEKYEEKRMTGSPKRGVLIDLNIPLMEEEVSSSVSVAAGGNEAHESGADGKMVQEVGKKIVRPFDLNQVAKNDEE